MSQCNMLSIWIVESKSKGSRFMRVVSPRQVGLRPARSVFRHETAVRQSHPRLALPVDRRRRAPGRHRHRAAPSWEATGSLPREAAGAVAGGSRSRVAARVEAAAPALPSRPERKGPGRYVEGGERLETAGRREPDALRASEERFRSFAHGKRWRPWWRRRQRPRPRCCAAPNTASSLFAQFEAGIILID